MILFSQQEEHNKSSDIETLRRLQKSNALPQMKGGGGKTNGNILKFWKDTHTSRWCGALLNYQTDYQRNRDSENFLNYTFGSG